MRLLEDALRPIALESSAVDGWTGFDLDGTLAHYEEWVGVEHIGAPIPDMVNLVKKLLEEGEKVKIFTARVSAKHQKDADEARSYIELWCKEHIGQVLEITNEKDMMMKKLYDDRAVQVVQNTGEIVE